MLCNAVEGKSFRAYYVAPKVKFIPMKIKLNNKELTIPSDRTKLDFLLQDQQLYREQGIAVAVNDEILPKSTWNEYSVKENDNILIITATQGG